MTIQSDFRYVQVTTLPDVFGILNATEAVWLYCRSQAIHEHAATLPLPYPQAVAQRSALISMFIRLFFA